MKAGLVNAEGQPQLSKAQAPVRVATTGRTVGPPLFESLEALGPSAPSSRAAGGARHGSDRAAAAQRAGVAAEATLAAQVRAHRGLLTRSLLVVYVGGTFVQVYRASRHDGADAGRRHHRAGRRAVQRPPVARAPGPARPRPRALRGRLRGHDRAHGRPSGGRRFTEATTGYNYLRDQDVPDEALLKEVDGTSTWESLAASARFLIDRARSRVILVTDGYHAKRVEAIADDLGLDASVSPSDNRLSRRASSSSCSGRRSPCRSAGSSATTACSASTTPSTTTTIELIGVQPPGAVR